MKHTANLTETAPPTNNRRGRKTVEARLEDIIASEKRLAEAKRIVLAERRAAERARRETLERMIGVACLADTANAATVSAVRAALDKHFTDDKNRAFLRAEGWLSSPSARNKGAGNE